jgi:hypothetical protein
MSTAKDVNFEVFFVSSIDTYDATDDISCKDQNVCVL